MDWFASKYISATAQSGISFCNALISAISEICCLFDFLGLPFYSQAAAAS